MSPTIEIDNQGHKQSYTPGITPGEILRDNPDEAHREVLAAQVNGEAVDLSAPLTRSGRLQFITANSQTGLDILRHSASHVMAQAVQELFPDVKVTIGPAIEDGFYYDFDSPRPFTPEDLLKIEGRMKEIVKSKLSFRRMEMSKEEAVTFFGRALERDPDHVDAHYGRALGLLALGRPVEARRDFEAIVALRPEGVVAEKARLAIQQLAPGAADPVSPGNSSQHPSGTAE